MSERRDWRILGMPLLVIAVAAAIWAFNRPPELKPPPVKPADTAGALRLLEQGKKTFAKAEVSPAPDWEIEGLNAMRNFRDAVTADGDNLEIREWCARSEAFLGILQQAQNNLDFILKKEPGRVSARELRAQIRWRLAFATDAHVLPRHLDRWKVTRDPPAPKESAGLRKLAEEDFAAAKCYWPLNVAQEHWRAGRLDEAQRLAAAADPRMPEASMMLALVGLERGQEFRPFLESAVQRGFAPARMVTARLAIEAGEWERAFKESKAVTDFDPTAGWVDAWLYEGVAARRLGKEKEAKVALDYALQLDPSVEAWIPK